MISDLVNFGFYSSLQWNIRSSIKCYRWDQELIKTISAGKSARTLLATVKKTRQQTVLFCVFFFFLYIIFVLFSCSCFCVCFAHLGCVVLHKVFAIFKILVYMFLCSIFHTFVCYVTSHLCLMDVPVSQKELQGKFALICVCLLWSLKRRQHVMRDYLTL